MRSIICFIALLALAAQANAITFSQAAINAGYTTSSGGIINLEGDNIDDLDGATDYVNAIKFTLNNNNIATITSGDFSGLSNITNLEFDENPLTTIVANAFTGLNNLESFFFQKHNITDMDDAAFNGLDSLEVLYLRGNELTNISATVFSSLWDTLDTLSLASCKITTIEPGAFTGAVNLEKLYLNYNRITHLNLDEADFRELSTFTVYDMEITDLLTVSMRNATASESSLTTVLNGLSSYADHIQFLDLSGTVVSNATSLTELYNFSALQSINLKNTSLSSSEISALVSSNSALQVAGVNIAVDTGLLNALNIDVSTNGWGLTFTDQDVVYVEPIVDITTSDQSVDNSITTIQIDGTNSTVITGNLAWSNTLTAASGSLTASSSWSIAAINLAVGDNVITVSGTNSFGASASDTVTITRNEVTPVGNGILSVSPATAEAGASSVTLQIEIDPSATPPPPPSQVNPSAIKLDTLTGASITRSGFTVEATFNIPAGMTAGFYEVTVQFQGPQGSILYNLENGFEVTAPAPTGPELVVFVNENTPANPGSQNGATWDTAFEDLQDALAVVTTQEVWIAAGSYYPDEAAAGMALNITNDNPSTTFTITNAIAIYGGFNGSETNLIQRNPDLNRTVLSADIQQDDLTNLYGITEHYNDIMGTNASRVFRAQLNNTTGTIDGVTFTAGTNTSGGAGINLGGNGYYIINDCKFFGNWTDDDGGGLAFEADYIVVSDCEFYGNHADKGGGLSTDFSNDAIITNCSFSFNHALRRGGGISVTDLSDVIIYDSSFTENSSGDRGGGAYNSGTRSLTFKDCVFSHNEANEGGGSYSTSSEVTFSRCRFNSNDAMRGGGAFERSDTAYYENCLFYSNHATNDYGGGIYDEAATVFENCTIGENTAAVYGGGIYAIANPRVANTLIVNCQDSTGENTAQASLTSTSGLAFVTYSIVPGSGGSGAAWSPLCGIDGFANQDINGEIIGEGNFQLEFSSGAINAGSSAYSSSNIDYAGNARIYDSIIDIGCYESFDDNTDSDLDTLTDYQEGVTYKSNPDLADTDGDGTEDADELFVGTDLLDSNSAFSLSIEASTLSWPYAENRSYSIEGCTNLIENSWFPVVITGGSNFVETVDYEKVFYRINATVGP